MIVEKANIAASDLVRVWEAAVAGAIAHGFTIRFVDLPEPKTGTFDGLEIVLDPAHSLELQAFILLHLFGHSVQWVAPSLAASITGIQESQALEDFLVDLQQYETEAAQFGLQLLHEAGITEVDRWFSDLASADWKYVETYYREGRIPELSSCFSPGAPPVASKPIPPLEHRRVEVRFAF